MLSNWYVLFMPTQIRFNPLLGVKEHVFEYRDIVAIRTAPALIAPNRLIPPRIGALFAPAWALSTRES